VTEIERLRELLEAHRCLRDGLVIGIELRIGAADRTAVIHVNPPVWSSKKSVKITIKNFTDTDIVVGTDELLIERYKLIDLGDSVYLSLDPLGDNQMVEDGDLLRFVGSSLTIDFT
jgi:hypothetical protein